MKIFFPISILFLTVLQVACGGATRNASSELPPDAVDDQFVTAEDEPLIIQDILKNDYDPGGMNIQLLSVSQPQHGTLEQKSPGVYLYLPDKNYHGSDQFSYVISNPTGVHASAMVNITVAPVNDPPTLIITPALSVAEGESVVIDASKMALTDVDNKEEQLLFILTSAPTNGTLRLDQDILLSGAKFTQVDINANKLVYTHNGNEQVSDSFVFTYQDNSFVSPSQNMLITIHGQNDEPKLLSLSTLKLNEGAEETITKSVLSAIDVDSSDEEIVFNVYESPKNGILLKNNVISTVFTQADINSGAIGYRHSGNETTSDSFRFQLTDSSATSVPQEFQFLLSITPINDAPVTQTDSAIVARNGSVTISVLDNDMDFDSPNISVSEYTQPAHGTVTSSGKALVYVPTFNYSGTDSFTYLASDGQATSSVATVSVEVSKGWGAKVPLESHFEDPNYNSMADFYLEGSDIGVIWPQNSRLYAGRLNVTSRSWSRSQIDHNATQTVSRGGYSVVKTSDNRLHVIWGESSFTLPNYMYYTNFSVSDIGVNNLRINEALLPETIGYRETLFKDRNDNLTAMWGKSGSPDYLHVTRRHPVSGAWSTPFSSYDLQVNLSQSGKTQVQFESDANGNVFALTDVDYGLLKNLYYLSSFWVTRSFGDSFVSIDHIDDKTDVNALTSKVDVRDGRLYVLPSNDVLAIWKRTSDLIATDFMGGARYEVWANRFDASLQKWTGASQISSSGMRESDLYQALIDTQGNLTLIMAVPDLISGNAQVWAIRYNASNKRWEGLLRLDNQVETATARIFLGAQGETFVYWAEVEATQTTIYSRRFSNGMWSAITEELSLSGTSTFNYSMHTRSDGTLFLLENRYDGSFPPYYYYVTNYYQKNGQTWSGALKIIGQHRRYADGDHVLTDNSGNVYLFWEDCDPNHSVPQYCELWYNDFR